MDSHREAATPLLHLKIRCNFHQPHRGGGFFERLGFTCVRRRVSGVFYFVISAMSGPVSYFLFAGVDILLAFSCGIMIKPDSILLSLCCIISMGQYFWYYQCNLEYLLGVCVTVFVCVCVCVYSLFCLVRLHIQGRMEGTQSCRSPIST